MHVGAILMDLSKAFDCLPHQLIEAKLRAYGLEGASVSLVKDYLSGRRQCVQIGGSRSGFCDVIKGFPRDQSWDP